MAEKRVMRVLKKSDLSAIVAIDEQVSFSNRREYYERKIATITDPNRSINSSIVAEVDGRVAGFIIGDIYSGEFGIPETSATIDTLGVEPQLQHKGIAHELLDQFMMNMKAAGVTKVYTLVNWDDFALEKFFSRHKFVPSKRINLEFQMP
jgi:N-acetylglutamate synthase-like GNAT family acetyltransferase